MLLRAAASAAAVASWGAAVDLSMCVYACGFGVRRLEGPKRSASFFVHSYVELGTTRPAQGKRVAVTLMVVHLKTWHVPVSC